MRYPYCSYHDSRVLDSHPAEKGRIVRRRSKCLGCARRFTTYEWAEEVPLVVVKRDGRREVLDRNKFLRGIIKAFDKRSMSVPLMEKLADEVTYIRFVYRRFTYSSKFMQEVQELLKKNL